MTQIALPPSVTLFERSCTVRVGPVEVANIGQQTGLDVWFQVRRSLKAGEPSTCDLRLYNLQDSTRKAIEHAAQQIAPAPSGTSSPITATPVSIIAGYVGRTSTVFLGELRSAQTVQDDGDTVTELTTGDGDSAAILARSTACFGAGANALLVAKRLLADMGLGLGNIATVAPVLQASRCYQKGVALKGASWDLLVDLATSCGLEVTLQHGVPQWTSLGRPLGGLAYLLQTDPMNTGVTGSPSVDTKGVLTIETLMLPGIGPGSPIMVRTAYIEGLYRVTAIETTGDTRGKDWKHSIEGKKYGIAP